MTTYLKSLQTALHDTFRRDETVFLLGEDVLDPYGGAFKVSKGLSTAYPDRVLTTPISEAAITGVAAGMAMRGLNPVVEIMFGDFLTLCTDQIVNHIAKFRGMFNDQVRVPVVIRAPMGGGRGYGATHSQSIEKIFLGTPDIRIAAPSHAHDPGAMLAHAILQDQEPVLFIEHKQLYPLNLVTAGGALSLRYSDEIPHYPTALLANHGAARPDVTLIGYGGASRLLVPLMEDLAKEEINLDAVLPASLKPLPVETLVEAAARSGRVVIVEEGTEGFNWGSEVAAILYEHLHGRLQAPIRRLASADGIIPASQQGEADALVQPAQIEAAILELLS